MYNKDKIIEAISNMSIIEINELINEIENKFSINLENSLLTNNFNNNKKQDKLEEKNKYDISLKDIGKNKISVIKSLRTVINLGLKESKDLIESCPVVIKKNVDKIEAENIKKVLEDAGALIELS